MSLIPASKKVDDIKLIGNTIIPSKFYFEEISLDHHPKIKERYDELIEYYDRQIKYWKEKKDNPEVLKLTRRLLILTKLKKTNRQVGIYHFLNSDLVQKTIRFYKSQYHNQQFSKNIVMQVLIPDTIKLCAEINSYLLIYLEKSNGQYQIRFISNKDQQKQFNKLQLELMRCLLKYYQNKSRRWVYYAIRLGFRGGGAHSNAVFVDFGRKRVYLIEPHVTSKWDQVVLKEVKKQMSEMHPDFEDYDYRSLRTELASCPDFKVQGRDELCQSWALMLTYLYLKHEGEMNLGSLLQMIGSDPKLLKKRVLEFIYYIYHQMKDDALFQEFLRKPIEKDDFYDLGEHPYKLSQIDLLTLKYIRDRKLI